MLWTCPRLAGYLGLHFASSFYHFYFLFYFAFCVDACKFITLDSSITSYIFSSEMSYRCIWFLVFVSFLRTYIPNFLMLKSCYLFGTLGQGKPRLLLCAVTFLQTLHGSLCFTLLTSLTRWSSGVLLQAKAACLLVPLGQDRAAGPRTGRCLQSFAFRAKTVFWWPLDCIGPLFGSNSYLSAEFPLACFPSVGSLL